MRYYLKLAFAGSMAALSYSQVSYGQSTDQENAANGAGFGDIIVTARREAESIQSVPVAVSVIGKAQFEAQGAFRPEDIAQSVPGLAFSGGPDTDRGNMVFTIRGQGLTYGALFPSVITYFNEVPTRFLAVGQFYDSESLQVLRGPQGVQFGRVTNGGNVMLTPNRPTDELSAEVSLKAGNYNLIGTTGFANLPVSDTLMVRFAWDVAKRDGFTKNLFNGKDLDDVNYQGGRVGILWKPSDTFENYTVVQYQHVDDNGTSMLLEDFNPVAVERSLNSAFPLVNLASELGLTDPIYGIDGNGTIVPWAQGITPLNIPNFIASLNAQVEQQQQLGKRKVFKTYPQYNKRKFLYAVNTTTADLSDTISLKNVVGYTRVIERSAASFFGDNGSFIQPCHTACPFNPGSGLPFINQEQFSEELRLSGKMLDGRLTWSLGGYMDEQRPGGPYENDTIFGSVLEYIPFQNVTTKSRAVYGYAEYELLDGLKINGGARYTRDTVVSQNATYNSLLPVPGLEEMVRQNLILFGTDPAIAAQLAAAAAISGSLVPHGRCEDYSAGPFSATCVTTKGKFKSTTWSLGASYQASPRQLVYAKYSKGYRPGGVNATTPEGLEDLRAFAPENNFSAEFGLKSDWQIGTVPLRTNIAVYYDRYKRIQQAISAEDSTGAPGSIITNVAAAKIWGIEFEGSIRPTDGMTIGVNYAYTKARFNRNGQNEADANIPGTPTYESCNPDLTVLLGFCSLNRFPATPKHQLGVNAHWDFIRDSAAGTFGIGGNWYYQSNTALYNTASSFFAPEGQEPSFSTLNLNANWTNMLNSNLDLTIFVTNVTNEIHRNIGNASTQNSGIGNLTNIYSPPRMFGGTLTARF